ncbi:hypothetical protein GW537_00930 [Piscirickettsia salmonis]|nr:hypothetical protein GW538_00935 [Piscirickettsia salmonis]QHS30416.1 hypothetical protein GW537_00930 [Piscirickettsia salmonis]
MADSEENQSRYPQHDAQKAGAGFPIMRLVAIMSLTTGGIIDYAVGAYKGKGTGEHALLRQIKDSIHKDDIVMGDRYFPCFRKRRYLGRYFAHPMMQNRRAKRDDYKPSAVRVTQRYVP